MDFVSHVDLLDPQGNACEASGHPRERARLDRRGASSSSTGSDGRRSWRSVSAAISSRPSPVTFVQDAAPTGVHQLAMPWRGIVKLHVARPQMGDDVRAVARQPGVAAAADERASPWPMTPVVQPIMFYKVYRRGDLTDPSLTIRSTRGVMRTAGKGVRRRQRTIDLATPGSRSRRRRTPTGLTDLVSRAPAVQRAAGEPGPRECPGVAGRYPRAARAPARALHVATQGLGAGGAERERDRAEGRGFALQRKHAVR